MFLIRTGFLKNEVLNQLSGKVISKIWPFDFYYLSDCLHDITFCQRVNPISNCTSSNFIIELVSITSLV